MLKIIPAPKKITEENGSFTFENKLGAYIASELSDSKDSVCELLPFVDFDAEGSAFSVNFDKALPEEAYTLVCDENGVKISASSFSGLFYACVTLKQILFFEMKNTRISIPFVQIYDEPRFGYRGLQLDESRHFFGKKTVKKLLDAMALYKLNRFHWHLTDDQGWRIEIKKYPLLTEIGSKRKDSSTGGWKRVKFEGKPHSGFYTREDIKEIVEYAARRNIMIIPEIDMPAHFAAAMAAYNYLGCREIPCEVHWFFGGAYPTKKAWFDYNRSACAGKESTYEFIFGVIDELSELFPAPYFHIGGDEAPKNEWKKCPECQKKIEQENLSGVEALQGYFNNRISAYLKTKGKSLLVWNEALKAENLGTDVIGQYWTAKKDKNVERFLDKGGKIIISKHKAFYFDMTYAQYTLEDTFCFKPENIVDKKHLDNVIGYEGELWTEWIATEEKLEFHAFPRVFALSEISWCEEAKSYKEFSDRVEHHKKFLDEMDINYAETQISSQKSMLKRKVEKWLWVHGNIDREFNKNSELAKARRSKG